MFTKMYVSVIHLHDVPLTNQSVVNILAFIIRTKAGNERNSEQNIEYDQDNESTV